MTVERQSETQTDQSPVGFWAGVVEMVRSTTGFVFTAAPGYEVELEQRARHVRVAAGIGVVVGTLFVIRNVLSEQLAVLGVIQLLAMWLLMLPAALLSQRPQRVGAAEYLLLTTAVVIFGALIVTGGSEGSGLFWAYIIPFLAFFMKGQRRGWQFNAGFVVLSLVYFLKVMDKLPFAYQYSTTVALLFISSLVFYTLVAAAFNQVRNQFEANLQQLKEQAEASNRAKSQFFAAASHDLRQPAHALGMFVARLTQLPHDTSTRELVNGVEASVRSLQEMLDAFFDYSRLESPALQVHVQAFAINPLLDQLRNSFEGMAASKGVRLRIRPSPVWLYSDPVLLHRVMLNLVSNALQYTTQGGVLLACRVVHGTEQVCIEVRDSGVGMDAEHHEKVFEEFYQIGNPERDRSKGLGLGLSIVARACRLLDHPLCMRSAVGCGTRFSVTVPLERRALSQDASARAAQETAPVASGLGDFDHLQVVLIEDDALGSAALKGLLESWGCQVTLVDTAVAACEQVSAGLVPKMIVSDFRLRGAHNGIDAVVMLRQMEGWKIPACLTSGDTAQEVRDQVQAAGLVLLQKPVRPAKLRSVLRHAVRAS